MRAWFNAMRGLIFYGAFYTSRIMENIGLKTKSVVCDLSTIISKYLEFDPPCSIDSINEIVRFHLSPTLFEGKSSMRLEFLEAVKKLASVNVMMVDKMDYMLLDKAGANINRSCTKMIQTWETEGFVGILDKFNSIQEKIITNQIMQSIIGSSSSEVTRHRLERMQYLGLLPKTHASKYIDMTMNIVKEVNNEGSLASLNRLLKSPFLQL
jgi:hypothetical protein